MVTVVVCKIIEGGFVLVTVTVVRPVTIAAMLVVEAVIIMINK